MSSILDRISKLKFETMNTVVFTFDKKYAEINDIIDYWCDYDEDTQHLNVYVDDVDDVLINNTTDDELCEFFGLESEYLITCNRSDYY